MTTPPRLRLVNGGLPAPHDGRDADGPDDDGDDIIDAAFPEDAGRLAAARDDDAARAAAHAARMAALARQVVAALVLFQLLACLRYLHWYVPLLRTGAVSPPAALAIPACLGLYVAAAMLAARRAQAACRVLFLVSAMVLAVSVPFWGLTEGWTWPLELGATLALAGAWYARPAAAVAGAVP